MGKLIQTISKFRASKTWSRRLVLIFVILLLAILSFLRLRQAAPSGQASKKLNTSCVVNGCNGEICQNKNDEPVSSICLWKEKFVCYKTAKCEVQKDGTCGWTMDQNLTSCLSQFAN